VNSSTIDLSLIHIILICLYFARSLESSPRDLGASIEAFPNHRAKVWEGEGREHALSVSALCSAATVSLNNAFLIVNHDKMNI
jgi:hypothetical protein